MTPADHQELAEIEASVVENKARRKRLMNRLRQRAFQAKRVIGPLEQGLNSDLSD